MPRGGVVTGSWSEVQRLDPEREGRETEGRQGDIEGRCATVSHLARFSIILGRAR